MDPYEGIVLMIQDHCAKNNVIYYDYEIGKAITLKVGCDVAIIATGTMVYNSQKAIEILEEQGISCTLIDMHTIKPLDKEGIQNVLNHKLVVTVEEHSIVGGLGSAVAEYLAQQKERPTQLIIGIEDSFAHAADYQSLVEYYELTPEDIANKIIKKVREV